MTLEKVDRFSERLVQRRFFYGWLIVAITFVTGMLIAGIGSYGLSFFVVPMAKDLGVTRTALSSVTLFRLIPVVIVPFLGMLVDRKHGPRLLIAFGGLAAGLALIATSRVQSLWQFYLAFGVVFGLATVAMGGQLVAPAVLSKWFVRKRGRAMAIGTMGISSGGFIIAPLAGWFIAQHGWRAAWAILGVVVILAVVPLSALFMRRAPEDVGLLPDGDAPSPAQPSPSRSPQSRTQAEYSFTVKQALRTRALWVLTAVQALGSLALLPVLIHQVAYIRDKGFAPETAAGVATTLAFFAIVAKLPWGYLTERMHVRWVVPLCLVPSGLSLLLLVVAHSQPMLYLYAALHGLTMGGYPTLMNVAWATFFGRRHTGAIRGAVTPVGNVIGAVSPVLAGWMWDRLGSYAWPFTIFAVAWVLAGALMLLARPPSVPAATVPADSTSLAT